MYYLIRLCGFRQYPCARLAALILQYVAICFPYHHLLDSGYCQLPVPTYCSVPRHDGPGYSTNPHTYLVRGSLAASTPGPRRLLQKFEQHVSNTCMIEHLRPIKSKTTTTDGGLSLIGQGTFEWMLTDTKGQQLVTGSGPVDGPATQASTTRSELHSLEWLCRAIGIHPPTFTLLLDATQRPVRVGM
jgi:hypothetical protein